MQMETPEEIANAISEGLNWLIWITQLPIGSKLDDRRPTVLGALDSMQYALEAATNGVVWSSGTTAPEVLFELSVARTELGTGCVSSASIDAAGKILEAFGLSQPGDTNSKSG